MSQQEFQDFLESAAQAFKFFVPYMLAGLVTSLVDFLRKHFMRERFDLIKLFVGLAGDLWLTFVIVCGAKHFGIGEWGVYALVAVLVSKGHEWIARVIDRRLGLGADK